MIEDIHCTRCEVPMRAIAVGGIALCPACGQAHLLALIPFSLAVSAPRPLGQSPAPHAAPPPAVVIPTASTPAVTAPHLPSPAPVALTPEVPLTPSPAEAVIGPPWPAGTPVLVAWNDTLLEALIVRSAGPELWEVTYPEWDENHNEVVGPDRIRPRPLTRPVTRGTPLPPGTRLQAEWEYKWYDAEVLEVQRDGLVRVHFANYDSSWDRSVTYEQLRLIVG